MRQPESFKKERSRAYPLVDLQTADEILRSQLGNLGVAPVDRELLAKTLGYASGEGGVAARKIGALVQYGLLDRHAKLYRVSLLGRRLQSLRPIDPEFYPALRSALDRPALFHQILKRYGPAGRLPENLALVLVQDYGITARACQEAEAVFVRSAWFADLLDKEGRFRDQPASRHIPPSQSQELPTVSSSIFERGSKPFKIPLKAGKEARLEFPKGMTREDLVLMERKLRRDLDDGALWEFLAFEKSAGPAAKPAEALDEPSTSSSENPNNLFPFSNRPGNQAS